MADRAHVREASRPIETLSCVLARVASLLLCATTSLAQATTWTVNNTGDPATGTAANCAAGNEVACTLRDALAAASDNDTIAFAVGSNQTITLTSNTELPVTHGITIDGSASPGLTIDGNNSTRVFHLDGPLQTVTVLDLTITHGKAPNPLPFGGGIYAENFSALTLTRVTIANNTAGTGGGLFLGDGNVTLKECTIRGNSASSGGEEFTAVPGTPIP
jgi:hypothetical protein